MMQSNKDSWQRLPIVELCEIHVDCVNRTAPVVNESTPFKMLRTTNVRNGYVDTQNVRYVTEETYKKWTRRLVPRRGDIILTREAPLGNVGKIRTDDKVFLGQRLYHFRPDPKKLDADFLLYSLLGEDLQSQIRGYGSGSTVEHMRLEDIPCLEFNVPSLPVQQRIAGILSAYDELIENSQRRIRILETMARAFYREWFVNFRFPGHETVPRIASPLGEIPQGWEVKKLFDLASVAYGKSLPTKNLIKEGAYPVYGAAKIIGRYNQFTRERPTIICGCRGSVGEMQITRAPCFVTNNSFTFDPTHPSNYFWLYLTLVTRGLRDVIGGAAQPQITLEGISSVELATPPLPLRSLFQEAISPMFQQIWVLDAQVENLRRTRDLLLPRLLSGQIDIEVLAIE